MELGGYMKRKVDLEFLFLGVTFVLVVALVAGLMWHSVREMATILTLVNIQ